MPESQPLPELTHLPQDCSQPGSSSSRRLEEPGASGQCKRYLASLDDAKEAG
ncbi:hypothetical protein I1E95_02035 [Synechococcus sp. CBW1107]|uniref:hypothetical protein n=1 Tax=Synechococcus sp. CBW1107 TaxID=2789857 RepID=UPI0018CF291D|nr:hypothetical protein [Synechococcus sp. CBW1107]QPN56981.1 hypothetical protein I1E95_02035 [Synechococcus sp. CBW1107]CAK6694962.1 hypothetical protein BBFGKLBO_01749 [Synechococcus sp. CBW1107]